MVFKLLNQTRLSIFVLSITLPFTSTFGAPPSGAYVGYTVETGTALNPVIFASCVNQYNHPGLPAAAQQFIQNKLQACNNSVSLRHHVLRFNNRNGTTAIPAGHVVVQLVYHNYREKDCATGNITPVKSFEFEYFDTLATGLNAGRTDRDDQIQIQCCATKVTPVAQGVGAGSLLQQAIVPKDPNWPAVPAGRTAAFIPFADQTAKSKFFRDVFQPNRTLEVRWNYNYDNCEKRALPRCNAARYRHELVSNSATYDPPNPLPTWGPQAGGPYCGM